MIKPAPYKLICPKCNYFKIVRPQSDCLNITEMMDICPKCAVPMKPSKISIANNTFKSIYRKLFGI